MRLMHAAGLVAAVVTCAAAIAACNSSGSLHGGPDTFTINNPGSGPTSPPVAHLTITPNPGQTAPGGQIQFTVKGYDAQNVQGLVDQIVWEVVGIPSPGRIGRDDGLLICGEVEADYPNSVKVSARLNGQVNLTTTASVIIKRLPPGPLVRIVVTPNPFETQMLAHIQFLAKGYDANGQEVPIPRLVWTMGPPNDPPGEAIDQISGNFTARSHPGRWMCGAAGVFAISDNIVGCASVIVGQ